MRVSAVISLSSSYGSSPGERVVDWILRWLGLTIRKNVARFPPDHELYRRRELNYPAYPEFPARILSEMDALGKAMIVALPHVKVPVLLIQSRSDRDVPFGNMEKIYHHLGSPQKEMLPMDEMSHSLVMDPKREIVFEAIANFLQDLGDQGSGG